MHVAYGRHMEKSKENVPFNSDFFGFSPGPHMPYDSYKHDNWIHYPGGKNYYDRIGPFGENINTYKFFKQQNRKMHYPSFKKPPSSSEQNNASSLLNSVGTAAAADTPVKKEKTPMCLVNELARFNKIEHKYEVTNEQGPSHMKVFFVCLKLGDERFNSSGQSIKKAQHAAATQALTTTKYPKPMSKSFKLPIETNQSITPTVELNALAMKRGEVVDYEIVGGYKSIKHNTDQDRVKHKEQAFKIEVTFGGKKYYGEGLTVKAARQSAALEALKGAGFSSTAAKVMAPKAGAPIAANVASLSGAKSSKLPISSCEEVLVEPRKPIPKSEITQVHEIAFKRNFTVNFEVTGEEGPPHLRNYVTACTCGSLKTEAGGSSKKISKRNAAEKMLEELINLPPITTTSQTNSKESKMETKKTPKFRLKKASPDYGADINPISRLMQIQCAKQQPEPVYSVLEERGKGRDREFHIQVAVAEMLSSAWGTNKKSAKRIASEKMLQLLGYCNSQNQSKTAVKKVTFDDVSAMQKERDEETSVMPKLLHPAISVGAFHESNETKSIELELPNPIQNSQKLDSIDHGFGMGVFHHY